MRAVLVLGLLALVGCHESTAPTACTQEQDFTWTTIYLRNAEGVVVDSLYLGICVR